MHNTIKKHGLNPSTDVNMLFGQNPSSQSYQRAVEFHEFITELSNINFNGSIERFDDYVRSNRSVIYSTDKQDAAEIIWCTHGAVVRQYPYSDEARIAAGEQTYCVWAIKGRSFDIAKRAFQLAESALSLMQIARKTRVIQS